MKIELAQFILELKKRGGHVEDVIAVKDGKMVYYREPFSYITDVKTKVFYNN